jgi:Rps23 Pro-64 3,4-dihydroxylase Tpa1-like proline 4-hydroxylase
MLHPGVQGNADDWRRQFTTNRPFRHVVIEPFLDPSFCEDLMAGFPSFDARHSINERGETGRKAVFPNLAKLGAAYARFDRLMQDREFLSFISRMTNIPDLLYDLEYVGGGTHENLDGQELDAHVDFNYHPKGQLHRRLNLIVFLNREWEENWGGCLELLRDPWATGGDSLKTVVPLANRAVLFETTESSWHGFRRIQLPPGKEISRRSIAVYFYTASRPALESAPSHGTVYYQRPLPEEIRPGHTLSEDDVTGVEALLARRDKQIQFLYDRELEFSQAIASITGSASFRLGRALTWPGRALRGWLRG